MNMQALLIRATVMTTMCIGLSVALAYRHPVAQTLPQTKTVVAAVQPVRSRGEPEPILLPTVVVRPSAAEIAAILADGNVAGEHADLDEAPTLLDTAGSRALYDAIAPALPSVRLDMPYYSFGKVLPRVSKE